jgi:nucleotide-binding universal stress UspA family protein
MLKVLLPVDGSENALRAAPHVASSESTCREPAKICLLKVQLPVASSVLRLFLSQRDLQGYYQDEGHKALASAREELQRLGVAFSAEVRVGDLAETSCAAPGSAAAALSQWVLAGWGRWLTCY